MERKIDEWSKSQNISSEQTVWTEPPPPPQADTEHVNAVFTESGKFDHSSKTQKDPPSPIIVNDKSKKDRPIKTSKKNYYVVETKEYSFREYIPKIQYPKGLNVDHSHLNRTVKVIEFGDSYETPQDDAATGSASEGSAKKKGRTVALTTEDMQRRRNDAAILKTFGGNEAAKKTKKNQLKQQYSNFKAEGSETLEQTFNRLHAIVSHMKFMDVEIEQDDLNQKFLTNLAPEWLMYTIVWRNRTKNSSGNGEVNTASILTASTQVSPASANGRRENYRQGSKKEEQAPKALMAIDGLGWDWSYMANKEENHALVADEEAPTEFALMAKSSSDSEVEARLVEFKNQEIKFCKKIRGLEFKVESKTNRIESLTNELEMLKKEKEELDSKLTCFQSASKDLDNLLGSQRSDKNKEGLGYSAGNSHNNIDDKCYWDSGCSWHMTSNISYLSDYEPYDGGTLRQHNLYSINLYNVVPHKDLTCLVAKAFADESMLWRMRLGHLNFKTMNRNFITEIENLKELKGLGNKSQNKTPYELFNGKTPAIGFLKPFGCHVIILNTLDHLGKFEAKGDKGYFIGYSMSSKAFRVFNKRTKRVEENLHVDFLENKLIETEVSPNWLFDIDTLTNSMNYVPVVSAGTTSTNFLGTKDVASQDVKKDVSSLRYISLPNRFHEAHLESCTSNDQDACKADAPESSGNSNPTATSTNPSADQTETLTVETPIPSVSSPVPTACLDDSPQPSSDTRLISKREEPKKIFDALKDPSWVEAMQEELIQFKIQNVWSLVGCPEGLYREFEALMHEKFQMSAMGELNFFLGLQVLQKKDDSFLSQEKYVGDILKKFGYSDFRSSNTPMDKDNPWGKNKTGKDVDLHLYRSMIRSLMYLTASRPDIMFATIVATSTTKAEYVAAASSCGQVLWTQNQLLDYGLAFCDYHNMIAILEKYEHNVNFHLIVDFVEASHIRIETMNEGTKILATVDGKPQTISESSIRRNLKLNDEAGISSLSDAELFKNLTLMGYNISPNQKFTFQKGEGSRTPTEPHHTPSPAAPQSPHHDLSSSIHPPVTTTTIPTDIPTLRQYSRRAMIAQSLVLPTSADKHASPFGDDSQGSLQQQLNELMDLCTCLQRQQTEMASKITAQYLEIASLKARIKLWEDKDGGVAEPSGEDATIKGRSLEIGEEAAVEKSTERGSNDTEELVNVLTSLDAASILTSGVQVVSVPLLQKLPLRKGNEKMVESDTPKKKKLQEQIDVQVAREIEEQIAREDQRMNEQITRDAKIAKIHAEEDLQMLIDSLDRNNETIAKYLQEYEHFAADLDIGERTEGNLSSLAVRKSFGSGNSSLAVGIRNVISLKGTYHIMEGNEDKKSG
nr:ribonuclease H-like domain-containing protein [Tanacetum cinerariifolium]